MKTSQFIHVTLSLVCLTWAAHSFADWPQWRGPHRDGVAHDVQLPTKWLKSPGDALWSAEIGEGYSSPVVSNGRLYIMARQEGDLEVCFCLNSKNGKEIWRFAYSAPYEVHPAARGAGKGPKSTPTVDGNCVYFVGVSGKMHCLDSGTGKLIWKKDFLTEFWGKLGSDGYDAASTYCGASAAPLILGDMVIYPVGGAKSGAVTAFHKKTGKMIWQAHDGETGQVMPDRSSYSSPIVRELAGVQQIIGFTGTRIVGLKADDGEMLWEHPFVVSYDQTIATPVVWGEFVIAAGTRQPTTALRISPKGKGLSMTVAWKNEDLNVYMTSPVSHKDLLYGIDEGGVLLCLDLNTGKTLWEGGDFGQYASITRAGDYLLILSEEGRLHILKSSRIGMKKVAEYEASPARGVWAAPALVSDKIFIKDKSQIRCYSWATNR